jgi:hypothetical protein
MVSKVNSTQIFHDTNSLLPVPKKKKKATLPNHFMRSAIL